MGVPVSLPPGRLAAVGAVVFAANAGLLVLQLAAGRLLAPFVGSSLETWTSVIAAFLTGIALGNAAGGPLADRFPRPRTLAAILFAGGLSAGWMLVVPILLTATGVHQSLPLGVRIPTLAALLCLPPGFVLSLLTPVAIRLGLTDVSRSGRVAGLMFALSTIGCLAGNYLTGFMLVPAMTVNALVGAVVGLLVLLAVGVFIGFRHRDTSASESEANRPDAVTEGLSASLSPRIAYTVVFLASFAGMALELAAARMMAQVVGVSLYTWTGVIGVMLAGTATGNWVGGLLADRASRSRLGWWLTLATAAAVLSLTTHALLTRVYYLQQAGLREFMADLGLIPTVLGWTFAVFFLPMFVLGTISPQVVRLATADLAHAGRSAGRVYAVSTAGAIAGTLITGFVVISTIGMYRTVLLSGALAGVAALIGGRVVRAGPQLYLLSIAGGGIVGGALLVGEALRQQGVVAETNYYTIRVTAEPDRSADSPEYTLLLDRLIHSKVRPADPGYLHYEHEHIQLEFLQVAGPKPRALVIGGGGYTFPRAARTFLPGSTVDVVEIDPGVTRVAYSHLGLQPSLGISSAHLDGRQFIAERAAPGSYDLVTLDAVNDLSVPAHLLTVECNQAVRRVLAPNGVYLVTVIDAVRDGRLWKAVYHTLRQTWPHVTLLCDEPGLADPDQMPDRAVLVLYASDQPLDLNRLRAGLPKLPPVAAAVAGGAAGQGEDLHLFTHIVPADAVNDWLAAEPSLVLTDQYAPVDNLMARVFRRR